MTGTLTRVEIRALGGFAAAVDGVGIPPERWPSLRATHLVQMLSLADGHRLMREQVIDALWPQLDPEAGAANLRKAAHHARKALGFRDAVLLRGGQVVLCPSAAVELDAARFETLAAGALARRDPAACIEAARAYGGELLPGSRYETWTDGARTRLRSRYLELLRAGAQWERLAEAEPTDEPAHRELMRRELAAGNRPAAIRWYARLQGALQQALGVAPGPETDALYDECVAGLRQPGPAFIGRQMELEQAVAWLRAPAGSRPCGLAVRGPAGIGKSAFCRALGAAARERGWSVVNVDAVQPGRPYAVIAAALEQVLLENRSVLEAVGAPARSVLAMLSSLAVPAPPLQGPLGRHQVIGAFRRALLAASPGAPVMVQVDDAHLIDESDAEALLEMTLTGRPVSIVLAFRPAPSSLAGGVARLAASGRLRAIDLGPLADEDAAGLVAHGASRPLAAALVARIVRLAEGSPFAALELARCAAPGELARLPANVREAVTARLCDVDYETMQLLRSLALAGDDLDTPLICALSPHAENETFAQLDRALSAQVLVVSGTRYRFRHDLVRQALLEQIAPHQRLAVHRDAARRLERLGAPPAAIARHWLAGAIPAEAAPWLLAAAGEAIRLGAFLDALRHLEPVLAYDAAHPDALRLRAEALDAVADPAAVAAYRAAAAAAGEPAAQDLRAKGALAQLRQGDPKGALQALEGVRPATTDGRLAEALTFSGAAALGFGDPAVGTLKAAESRRLALETGDTAAIVIASWAQAAAAHARGDLHGSVWADLHDTHHVPHLAVRVFDGQLCITQRFLYGAKPYAEVISFADALVAEAQRLGAARGHAFGMTLRGEAELLAGNLDSAEEHLALGGRLHRAIGGVTGEALALQRRAELALYRGRREAAAELLDEALDLARQTDMGFHLLDRIYGTRIALAADAQAALHALQHAQEAVRGPLETCPGCRITFAVPAAIAAARADRLDLAVRYEQQVEFLANVVMRLPAWNAALEEVQAHIARARGEGESVVKARFATAARVFREAGQPLDAARCERFARAAA
jgi:DNA-binding SARP family transcriptional activator/thymidylate kinase